MLQRDRATLHVNYTFSSVVCEIVIRSATLTVKCYTVVQKVHFKDMQSICDDPEGH